MKTNGFSLLFRSMSLQNKSRSSKKLIVKFNIYFAAMGFGIGLGNLWRFPYVVFENGGGAFILLYLFLAFLIAVPLLVSELLVGKYKKKPVSKALESLTQEGPKLWQEDSQESEAIKSFVRYIGYVAAFVCFLVLTYFAVISGWTLHFFTQYVRGIFLDDFKAVGMVSQLRHNGWLQILFAAAHILIVIFIVLRDRNQEKERWVGYLMPLFVLLIVVLAYKSLSVENASLAIKYLFYPDFSKLKITSAAAALGHLLFTLSVGFGAMITFGGYLSDQSSVPRVSLQIVTVDSLVSIFAGLLVFPLVMSTAIHFSGPELLFQAVPVLLDQIQGGVLFGLGFFFCLYIAALGSSIGLLETIVDNLRAHYRFSRNKAVWMSGGLCVMMAFVPAFSGHIFSHILVDSGGLLRLWDIFLINWVLPVLALVLSQVVLYKMDRKIIKKEFIDESSPVSYTIYTHWRFILKWIVPPFILLCLGLQFVGLFS